MNHADVQARLAEYFEGDLTLDKRARVDAHLDECTECAQELAELRATVRMLRTLPDPDPPPGLADAVMQRIREEEYRPGALDRLREILSLLTAPRIAIPAAAAVAAATAVAFVYGLRPVEPSPGARDLALARELARRQPSPVVSRAPAEPEQTRIAVQSAREPGATAVPDAAPGELQRRAAAPLRDSGLLVGSSTATQGEPRLYPVQSSGGEEVGLRNVGLVQRLTTPQLGTTSPRMQRTADDWLDVIEQKPIRYARGWSDLSIAERELWVSSLAERAIELKRLGDVVAALRASGDPAAGVLADSFARQEERILSQPDDPNPPDGDAP